MPSFVGRVLEYDGSCIEEPTNAEMLAMNVMANRVNELKRLGLIRVGMVTNWLARQVIPLKKQVRSEWE
jgi:hypothetical protein